MGGYWRNSSLRASIVEVVTYTLMLVVLIPCGWWLLDACKGEMSGQVGVVVGALAVLVTAVGLAIAAIDVMAIRDLVRIAGRRRNGR